MCSVPPFIKLQKSLIHFFDSDLLCVFYFPNSITIMNFEDINPSAEMNFTNALPQGDAALLEIIVLLFLTP